MTQRSTDSPGWIWGRIFPGFEPCCKRFPLRQLCGCALCAASGYHDGLIVSPYRLLLALSK